MPRENILKELYRAAEEAALTFFDETHIPGLKSGAFGGPTGKDKPAGGPLASKRDATLGGFRVSYLRVARPARNQDCLAGLKLGALPCARDSISDFATLVRKSYRASSASSVRWYW